MGGRDREHTVLSGTLEDRTDNHDERAKDNTRFASIFVVYDWYEWQRKNTAQRI